MLMFISIKAILISFSIIEIFDLNILLTGLARKFATKIQLGFS